MPRNEDSTSRFDSCPLDIAAKLAIVIQGLKTKGLSQRAMVAQLNQIGIRTAKGGEWSLIQLQRVIARTR